MINLLITYFSRVYGVIITVGMFVYSYMVKKNARLKAEKDILVKEKEDIKDEAKKIISIQKKQTKIASAPSPSRTELYKQLRKLSARDKAKH